VTDEPRDTGGPGDDELGEPIGELAELRSQVPRGLRGRIRNAIRRRQLAADVIDFSLLTTLAVLREYLMAVFQALTGPRSNKRDEET
jgi:hypothetical protein